MAGGELYSESEIRNSARVGETRTGVVMFKASARALNSSGVGLVLAVQTEVGGVTRRFQNSNVGGGLR